MVDTGKRQETEVTGSSEESTFNCTGLPPIVLNKAPSPTFLLQTDVKSVTWSRSEP